MAVEHLRGDGALRKAIEASGLSEGGRISFHHHLRYGDRVVAQVFREIRALGVRNVTANFSSVMGSACSAVRDAVVNGTVTRIETTGSKSPLSEAILTGQVPEPVVFRTHGGRARAIESGETPIDVAFVAVSAVDRAGNANGTDGPSRFGSLGYGLVDARHANHVVAITDYVSSKPLSRVSLPADGIDQVVVVDSIGDSASISGGSLRLANRPMDRVIARRAVEVLFASGAIHDGFGFQAGSGGVSLLVARMVAERMSDLGIKGGFISGGATETAVRMIEAGLFETLYDVQSFDDMAAQSLAANKNHLEMDASRYANPDRAETIASRLDVMILSATEVDTSFAVNSLTGTDGRIIGALGGAPDTAEGAGLTMVVLPALRGRVPTICRTVDTVCTPGEHVDVVVTERGVCVHPRRDELRARLAEAGVQTVEIGDLVDRLYGITGEPVRVPRKDRVVGVVESRRGAVLDTIRAVEVEPETN